MVLGAAALPIAQSSVVHLGFHAEIPQEIRPALHVLPGSGVDDTGWSYLVEDPFQEAAFISTVTAWFHRQREVGALEAGYQLERFSQVQLARYIGSDVRGGGCREGCHRNSELGTQFTQAQVVGSEVVSPLANAMGLIHNQARNSRSGKGVPESPVCQSFRGNVNQMQTSGRQIVQSKGPRARGRPRVNRSGRNTTLSETIHLILHESNERRHHNGCAFESDGGELVAQGLSRTGGHDGNHIAAGKNLFDQLALGRSKGAVPEGPAQQVMQVGPRLITQSVAV
jgi:hypothetical protein